MKQGLGKRIYGKILCCYFKRNNYRLFFKLSKIPFSEEALSLTAFIGLIAPISTFCIVAFMKRKKSSKTSKVLLLTTLGYIILNTLFFAVIWYI